MTQVGARPRPRIVQISAAGDYLYALDSAGNVWLNHRGTGWWDKQPQLPRPDAANVRS